MEKLIKTYKNRIMKVEAVVLKPTRVLIGDKQSSLPGLTFIQGHRY